MRKGEARGERGRSGIWATDSISPGRCFALVDAAFAPLFRSFDTVEPIGAFGVFRGTPRVSAYRAALSERPSVKSAVGADYPVRLADFPRVRGSLVSSLMAAVAA